MSQGLRYKFNGSTFEVQSGLGSPKTVTAITQADPGVASVAAHGYVEGDVVKFLNIGGMTQLSNQLVVVDNPNSGDFEMAGVDTSGYDAFAPGSPTGDSQVKLVSFTDFCELTGANQQDGAADQIEVTSICSTAKEFEQGLSDSGTLQLDYNAAPLSAVQTTLREAKVSGDQLAFRLTFPGDGGTIIMIGTVQQQSVTGQVNGVWTGSATIKLTGPIFVL